MCPGEICPALSSFLLAILLLVKLAIQDSGGFGGAIREALMPSYYDPTPANLEELKREAQLRKIELVILPTVDAIEVIKKNPEATNAILHVTC